MLGNLLDNACKWARTRVAVDQHRGRRLDRRSSSTTTGRAGAGDARSVLQRGVRADEAAPGSGLGLAIVRDLAELYGGSITLDGGAAGGLRARLRLPAVRA